MFEFLSRFKTMTLRQLIRLLLFWSTLYLQTPDGSAVKMTHVVRETNSGMSPEFPEDKPNTLQIEPKIPVNIILGNATELQCGNETREGKHSQVLPVANNEVPGSKF